MSVKKEVQYVFSKNKDAYVTSSTHSNSEDLSLAVKWLKPHADMIALDVATGGGHAAKYIAPFVKSVVATDITKEMLENTAAHLTRYDNVDYVIADAEQLPFLDNTFDIITCRIAAHHFPRPDQFVSEVKRVLKDNGKFLLIDNVSPDNNVYDAFINKLEKIRDYSHVRSWKIEERKQLLSENNLNILQEQQRRKTLPYKEWVTRTLDSEREQNDVEEYMKHAPDNVTQYFEIKIEQEKIRHFTIDEWMVLCTVNSQS